MERHPRRRPRAVRGCDRPPCSAGVARAGGACGRPARRAARGHRGAGVARGVPMMVLTGVVAAITAIAATPTPAPTPTAVPISVPGSGIFQSSLLLSLMVFAPVLVAVMIAVLPNPRGRFDTLMKQIAFFTNIGLLFILWIAYNQFQNFLGTMQFEENLPWLTRIGVSYHLGIDGPGLVMLILSGLIGLASVLASWGVRER